MEILQKYAHQQKEQKMAIVLVALLLASEDCYVIHCHFHLNQTTFSCSVVGKKIPIMYELLKNMYKLLLFHYARVWFWFSFFLLKTKVFLKLYLSSFFTANCTVPIATIHFHNI